MSPPARPHEGRGLLLNTLAMPIRWGDMDALGHVNNTVYFRYLEQVRIDWFDRLGLRAAASGTGPVVVRAGCSFLVPLVYPGTVVARQFATAVGRSSIDTRVELSREDEPGRLCAEGTARIVWVDFGHGRSTPLPEAMRSALAGLSAASG